MKFFSSTNLLLVAAATALLASACPETATQVDSCVQHSDCASGSLCQSGLCVVGTPCSSDGDCAAGQCINAACLNELQDAGLVSFDAAPGDSAQTDTAAESDAYVPTCGLSMSPDPVEFGAVRVGAEIAREVEIRNDNENDMQVLGVSIVNNSALNEFSIDADDSFMSGALPVGQSKIVRVVYSALDALPDNAQLQVLATGCEQNSYLIDLTAEFKQSPNISVTDLPGDQGVEVSSLDFGELRVGQFAQEQIFIKNTHAESGLMIDAIQLQPVSDGTFGVADIHLPTTLSQWLSSCVDDSGCNQVAGESCGDGACRNSSGQYVDMLVVTLQFAPGTEQTFNTQLRIESTDAEHSPTVITLLGTGLPAHECPEHDNSSGQWSEADSLCVWACEDGWYDLNGDLQLNIGSDGCEYECTVQDGVYDEPDMAFVDANCDGMDGVADDGWFVSASAGSCTGQGCGSKLHPYNNIEAAISAADSDATRKKIYVSDETYDLAQTLDIPPGLRIYGGYRVLGIAASLQWRDRQGATSINGQSPALTISDASTDTSQHTLLQNLIVRSAAGTAQNPNSIVAVVEDSPNLVFEAMTLNAAAGLDGQDAVTVNDGADGLDGVSGFGGCDYNSGSNSCFLGGAGAVPSDCTGTGGGRGGNGGTSDYGADDYNYVVDDNNDVISSQKYGAASFTSTHRHFHVDSGPFKEEHVGLFMAFTTAYCDSPSVRCRRITNFVNTTTVELGLEAEQADVSLASWTVQYNRGAESGEGTGTEIYGGAGGTAGDYCDANVDPPTSNACCGNSGETGNDGLDGSLGAAGVALSGHWDGQRWLPGDGADGAQGGTATGGEGGGGGGGGDCSLLTSCFDTCVSDRGGGGGGGGSAGCPGEGGLAGTGGGASIGVIAIHSAFSIVGGRITTADAGKGGDGSAGGAGGQGGLGAGGGAALERSGAGGAGGNGGRGGYGGGGAGGSGGDVFGIAYLGTAPIQSGGLSFTLGQVGQAGLGGDGAPAGFCNGSDCGEGEDGHSGRAANSFALQ